MDTSCGLSFSAWSAAIFFSLCVTGLALHFILERVREKSNVEHVSSVLPFIDIYRPVMIYHAHLVARSSWHDLVGDVSFLVNMQHLEARKHSRVWLWYGWCFQCFVMFRNNTWKTRRPYRLQLKSKNPGIERPRLPPGRMVEAVSFEPVLSNKHLRNMCPSKIKDWDIPSRCTCILQFFCTFCIAMLVCIAAGWFETYWPINANKTST